MKKSRIPNIILITLLSYLAFFTYKNFDEVINGFNKLFSSTIDIINKSDLLQIEGEGSLVNEDVSDLEDSKIHGENLTFDVEFYPYYGLLTENEKTVYKQVYANAIANETTFLPTIAVSVTEASRAIEAVYNDHPELFWVDTSYSYKYNSENKCVQIILSFNGTFNDIEESKRKFFENANHVISTAQKLNTDYEKEKYVHDAIIGFASYDVKGSYNQSAYSALVTGKTVCAGYSRAFQYIMTNLGIPTYYIYGSAEGEHAWNIIKLDGEFYNVDLTWNDGDKKSYAFFNVPDEDFEKSHTRTKESTLLPKCTGTKYSSLEGKYVYKDSKEDTLKQNQTDKEESNNNLNQDENIEIP